MCCAHHSLTAHEGLALSTVVQSFTLHKVHFHTKVGYLTFKSRGIRTYLLVGRSGGGRHRCTKSLEGGACAVVANPCVDWLVVGCQHPCVSYNGEIKSNPKSHTLIQDIFWQVRQTVCSVTVKLGTRSPPNFQWSALCCW